MADFYFIRPDEMMTLNGAVAGGADTNYLDDWVVDGRVGRPARAATGTQTWTVTNSAKNVSLIAVCNHNIDAARTISITGDITTSMVGPALPPNAIPLNPHVSVSATSTATLAVGVASNTVPLIIGEFVAGLRRTLERNLKVKPEFRPSYRTLEHESEFDSLLPYDKGIVARRLSGEVTLTDAGLADVQNWWDSTRGNTKYSLIVPNATVQDAWLVQFLNFSWEPDAYNRNVVQMVFQEYPRSRW